MLCGLFGIVRMLEESSRTGEVSRRPLALAYTADLGSFGSTGIASLARLPTIYHCIDRLLPLQITPTFAHSIRNANGCFTLAIQVH